jgi:energy-coupling factor transport system permease protein
MFNTWAWVIWLVAGAVPAFTLHNPLYLVLILGAAWIVYATLGRTSPIGNSWGAFVKLGLSFFALTIAFNALSIHIGRIVLFHLPVNWPVIGGTITLEAVIAGAVSGLTLLTILVVFAAFNSVVDHYQLMRATPPFLFQAGVVISIAIAFVPQMVLSAREIRQAQRIRGHRFRGLRDLLPLIMPLLANSLERAIQLAETMEARGFGSVANPLPRRMAVLVQTLIAFGLLSVLASLTLMAYSSRPATWAWLPASLGVAGLLLAFGLQGRQVHRTRYRRPPWHTRDTILAMTCGLVIAVVILAKATLPGMLAYTPFPPNPLLPPFNALVGGVLLLLVLPTLLVPRSAGQVGPTTSQMAPLDATPQPEARNRDYAVPRTEQTQ